MNITPITDLPIEDVINPYIKLTKKGATSTANCPFHTEKSASFKVHSHRNYFHCFGCKTGGNSITFIMKHLGLTFFEACKKIAEDHKLNIDLKPITPEEKQLIDKKETLMAILEIATKWFQDQLYAPENEAALKYALTRWTDKQIQENRIGYAPSGWENLLNFATKQSITKENLIASSLCAQKGEDGKVYDFFRNRIMFPIKNRFGRVISYSGRILPEEKTKVKKGEKKEEKEEAKYINCGDTIIYQKSKTLFGLDVAARSIKEKGFAFIVEGNPDVIRLHGLNKYNTVAACGTALTDDHISLLKTMCNSVTIIGDSDFNKSGINAVIKNGEKIINAGLFCNVIELPESKTKEEKHDPDSFFKSEKQFNDHASDYVDYIIWRAVRERSKCTRAEYKLKVIKDLAPLISKIEVSCQSLIIDELSEIIKPKRAWTDELKIIADEQQTEIKKRIFPKSVDVREFDEFGFYEEDHQYKFKSPNSDAIPKSNFTMVPKFHISSVLNAKRTYILTNRYGRVETIEFAQKDLINLSGFKLRIESIGNFIWEGTDAEFGKLKRFLYKKTTTAYEIIQLGWQSEGHFWAWSNGLFDYKNNVFIPMDENGVAEINGKVYYSPAFSKMYIHEKSLFIAERMFKHTPGNISITDYFKKLINVYGDKAMTGIAFYIATLFRDNIFHVLKFFPILNLFGPPMSGKSEMALSLLQFFGPQVFGPNLTNASRPAIADHVAQLKNAITHLEEYKNSIEIEKVEMIKGFFGGTGRSKMNMEKDKKKETSSVDAGIIICGQEMATADIATFTRFLFETFTRTEFSKEEQERFRELETISKLGLTHITHEIMIHRDFFVEHFYDTYLETQKEVVTKITTEKIDDRIMNNWVILLTTIKIIQKKITIPFNYESFLSVAIVKMKAQNAECGRGNEMGIFWRIFEYLVNNNNHNMKIFEGEDFHIKYMTSIKTDKLKEINWKAPKRVLIMRHGRVFELYRKHGLETKENILPTRSLEFYLCNEKSYLGRMTSVSYKNAGSDSRKVTTGLCFDYDLLNTQRGFSVENDRSDENNIEGSLNENEVTALYSGNKTTISENKEENTKQIVLPFD